jgi:hypothetical protein
VELPVTESGGSRVTRYFGKTIKARQRADVLRRKTKMGAAHPSSFSTTQDFFSVVLI